MALFRCGGGSEKTLKAFYYATVAYNNDCVIEYFPKSTSYTLDRGAAQNSVTKGGLTVARNGSTGICTFTTTFDCVGYIDGVETQFTANTPVTKSPKETTYKIAIPVLE